MQLWSRWGHSGASGVLQVKAPLMISVLPSLCGHRWSAPLVLGQAPTSVLMMSWWCHDDIIGHLFGHVSSHVIVTWWSCDFCLVPWLRNLEFGNWGKVLEAGVISSHMFCHLTVMFCHVASRYIVLCCVLHQALNWPTKVLTTMFHVPVLTLHILCI